MITKKLLKRLNLTQKNDRVFFAINNHSYFSMNDLKLLKKAINKSVKLFRVCLHKDTSSQIQEMIICHIIPQKIGPLKQKKESISYHLITGELTIRIAYNNKISTYKLDKKNHRGLRIPCNVFREVISTKKNTTFLEISTGPFFDKQTIWQN